MEQKEKLIGIFVARAFEENNLNFIHAMHRIGKKQGYKLVVFSLDTCVERNLEMTSAELEFCGLASYLPLEAYVILGETIKNRDMIDCIAGIAARRSIPCFCMDREAEGCYLIDHNYNSGFEQMVRHVIEEHGVRRVNMLAGFEDNELSNARLQVFKKVLQENGIPVEEERIGYGQFWETPAQQEMERFLQSELPMPEAIICANDAMALVACNVLEKAGYRVPEDVIVTGFDGINDGKYYLPTLSTCVPDYDATAWFILDKVLEWRESGQMRPEAFAINYVAEKNQSCGCQPKDNKNRNEIIRRLASSLGDCAWHTHAMNEMVTGALPLQSMEELTQILPKIEYIPKQYFRYAAVKQELFRGSTGKDMQGSMVSLLCGGGDRYFSSGESFAVKDRYVSISMPDDRWEIMLVRLLNAGKTIYGYTVDGFKDIEQRDMQRCDEFSMFLSNTINLVLQNQQLNILKHNLMKANKELASLSELDAMTELYNRRGFYKHFARMAAETSRKYAVLVSVDMNRLKYINDNYGHIEGDFAICALAHAVRKICGDESVCARFGGDEFDCIIFADDIAELTEEDLGSRLQQCIDETEGVSQKPYPITASIGVVARERTDELDVEQMIGKADTLMYSNKRKVKGNRS